MKIPQVSSQNKNIWYLQFDGSDFGPLTIAEALAVAKSGKLNGALFAWRPGFPEWVPIELVPELADVMEKTTKAKSSSDSNRRKSVRLPLLAVVRYSTGPLTQSGSKVHGGICKDISVGGMQVLGHELTDKAGSMVYLEVTPVNSDLVQTFEAIGVIRNLLPANQGFGLEFKTVPEQTRKQIQAYSGTQPKIKPATTVKS